MLNNTHDTQDTHDTKGERGRTERRGKERVDARRERTRSAEQRNSTLEMNAAEEAESVSQPADDQTAGRVSDPRRISLSSGPSQNPAPPPRSQESHAFLLRALCVTAAALLCELLVLRWRQNAAFSTRLVCLLLACCFLLLLMSKTVAEEKLAAKVHGKLRDKLDDSFKGCRSAVKGVWTRLGVATEVGFGLVVAPPPSTTAAASVPDKDKDKSSGDGAAAAAAADTAAYVASKTPADHLLAVSFVRTRAQPPWMPYEQICTSIVTYLTDFLCTPASMLFVT